MLIEKVVFMGTPRFAVPALEALAASRFKPLLCITQPDKPKGRNRQVQPPEVKLKAMDLEIPLLQTEDVNDEKVVMKLRQLAPHVIITVAYGGYLGKAVRTLPAFGCLNLHPSLLPRHRGSAPINYTLFNGDRMTGNTIFKLTAGMDAGPILFQNEVKIEDSDNYTILYEKLSRAGAEDILKVLEKMEQNEVRYTPQNNESATFSYKLQRKNFLIDWRKTAREIHNQVRGLAEIPGAVAAFRQQRIKIIETEVSAAKSKQQPGTVIEANNDVGFTVCTSDFDLHIKRVQPAGKKIMSAYAFHLGARLQKNEFFQNGF